MTRYLVFSSEYDGNCLVDEFDRSSVYIADDKLLGEVSDWNSKYVECFMMDMSDRFEKKEYFKKLDLEAFEIIKKIKLLNPGWKIKYYSEIELDFLE